jgi:hypothetical protein
VERTRHDDGLGGDAAVDQAARIGEILVDEEIDRADADEGGRQSLEAGLPRRHRARRDPGGARGLAEEAFPAEAILRRGPQDRADRRRGGGDGAGAIVEHRVDQHLQDQRHLAAVARGDREQGGMTAAGALAHHRDPAAIDAEFVGMVMDPFEPGIIIVDRTREAGFGRQPIVDGDDHAVERRRGRLERRDHAGGGAGYEAAAMDVDDRRLVGARLGIDDIDRDVGGARQPRDHLPAIGGCGQRRRQHVRHHRSRRRERGAGRIGERRGLVEHHRREGAQFGVDEGQVGRRLRAGPRGDRSGRKARSAQRQAIDDSAPCRLVHGAILPGRTLGMRPVGDQYPFLGCP